MYTSKYKLGQSVTLEHPFSNVSGIIDGIRYDSSTIRYDVLVDDKYNIERIFPDIIKGESSMIEYPSDIFEINDDEYYIIVDNIIINNCRIIGLFIYLDSNGETSYRYNVGYINTKNTFSMLNPDIVFRKEDAISLIRDNKLNKIL